MLKELVQSADWKAEKHVPAIESPASAKKGEWITVNVTVGKEIAHPNTTEHHIRWIALYFKPQNEKFPCQLAKCDFDAHGESVQGPNTSTISTNSTVVCAFKTDKPGVLMAVSYCNIHGLWESAREIAVE